MSLLNDALRKKEHDNKPIGLRQVAKGLRKRKTTWPSMVLSLTVAIFVVAIVGTVGWVLFLEPPVDAGVNIDTGTNPSDKNPIVIENSEFSDSLSIPNLTSAVTRRPPPPNYAAKNVREFRENADKTVSNVPGGNSGDKAAQTLLFAASEPLAAAAKNVAKDELPRNPQDKRPSASATRIASDIRQNVDDRTDVPGDRLSPWERLYRKGQSYHRQKRYYQAIQMYEGVLDLRPDHEAARFNLASAYIAVKDYSGAKPLLETLFQDKKDNIDLLLNLSIVAIGTGDPAAALNYLAQLEQKSPRTNFDLFFHRGVAYRHLGQNEKALEWYRRAYQLNAGHPELVFNMAVACDVLQRYSEAIQFYVKYIDLFKDIQPDEKRRIKHRISQLRTFVQVNLNIQ